MLAAASVRCRHDWEVRRMPGQVLLGARSARIVYLGREELDRPGFGSASSSQLAKIRSISMR